MIVYQTDSQGVFFAPTTADEDPLNPGNYLIPGGCVLDAPPATGPNQAAQRSNGAWVLVADFRGETFWVDGKPFTITEVGVDRPANATDTYQPPSSGGAQ